MCVHLWHMTFKSKKIVVQCDNMAVCIALNSGKAKCKFMQKCLREIIFFAALNEFEIKAVHISGVDNRIADHLSRWHLNESHRKTFEDITKEVTLYNSVVQGKDFTFINP